jgi:DNA ligase D-like protein (predicted 3'-phosphoesterase)
MKEYRKKRNFDITAEPFGAKSTSKDEDKQIFVFQKHNASSLHYDFRLSVDGVLKSWVIPKGPSTNSDEKRLAIPTEDHPFEYAYFEGVIPEDQYGGGTVMVWDAGTYDNITKDDNDNLVSLEEQLKNGHVKVVLNGKKIQGAYVLIRTQKDEDEKWLLKKVDDDKADARRKPTSTENKSVLSNRSMKEIQSEAEKDE